MRLTSKGRYAVRAMLDLAQHDNGNPVRLQEISTRQNISLHYLEQLFRKLRGGQVVRSIRGPGGGYVLARSKDEITIKDVLGCVGENINPARDILGTEAGSSNSVEFHLSKNYFVNLGVIMEEYLQTTSLGDLTRKSNEIVIEPKVTEADVQAQASPEAAETAETTAQPAAESPFMSSIRSSIGEINQ